MLTLLLDENLSPEVAKQITGKRPDVSVITVHHWHDGRYMAQSDEAILAAAIQEDLTLITYDQRTIIPLLTLWGLRGIDHAGLVFIDDRSIASNDFGAIVRSLIDLWDSGRGDDWKNRIEFLKARP